MKLDKAIASDRASAQTILEVGAKLFGQASLNTDAFRKTFEYTLQEDLVFL